MAFSYPPAPGGLLMSSEGLSVPTQPIQQYPYPSNTFAHPQSHLYPHPNQHPLSQPFAHPHPQHLVHSVSHPPHQPHPQHLSHPYPHPHPHPHPHPYPYPYPHPSPHPHPQHHPHIHPLHPPYPNTPMNSLPQHSRFAHIPNPLAHSPGPLSRPSASSAKPIPFSSAHVPRNQRTTRDDAAAAASRKRSRKTLTDGIEGSYLHPGPTNRLYLSLKSGLASQIDWALSRLAHHSFSHRDHFSFESIPGLADQLLIYPRRICLAVAGQPRHLWQGPEFEQEQDACDVGIGAPGEGPKQGAATWFVQGQGIKQKVVPSLKPSLLLMPSSTNVVHSRIGSLITSSSTQDGTDSIIPKRQFTFDPAHDPLHTDLMRRALEAALVLRNLTMQTSNARHVASIKGIYALIRDVLVLPSMVLVETATASSNQDAQGVLLEDADDEWIELEGISELRLHFLDILEGIAPKLHLSKRADFSVPPKGLAGCSVTSHLVDLSVEKEGAVDLIHPSMAGQDASMKPKLQPTDEIFLHLLSIAHHSNDRTLLISSLRCLSAIATSDKNEAAFYELDLPDGSQSPGLLARCVELLPLTQDQELQEATLDLLYQLICIGNNGFKLASPSPAMIHSSEFIDGLSTSKATVSATRAQVSASARSFSHTFALVRLLTRNLSIGKAVWERDHKLTLHREWAYAVPGRAREAMRKEREARMRRAAETPEERARKKRLTPKEKEKVVGLNEPERGIAWMKVVFQGNPNKEVTQMEFWTAYKEEFFQLAQTQQGAPLQPAADLIRAVSQVFPGAAAMVIPAPAGGQPRFVIRGIEVRERDHQEPFKCGWKACPSPDTLTVQAQKGHAETHVEFSADGRCRWLNCDSTVSNVVKNRVDDGKMKENLLAHVLTHLPTVPSPIASGNKKEDVADSKPKIVVDENLRVVQGASHTGQAIQYEKGVLPNSARYIKGKRNANGEEIRFRTRMASPEVSDRPTEAGSGDRSNMTPSTATETSSSGVKGLVKSGPPASGTVENPGVLTFEVIRTPSSGADDNPSPQGVAFVSLLILRMLTRNAASLLEKAGVRSRDGQRRQATENSHDAVALRGEGDEKFGLPLPANFGDSNLHSRSNSAAGQDATGGETVSTTVGGNKSDSITARHADATWGSAGHGFPASDHQLATTETWAIDAAARFMDAMLAVEDELVQHSYCNDILCRYINDTLAELRNRPAGEKYGFEDLFTIASSSETSLSPSTAAVKVKSVDGAEIDPDVKMDHDSC